MTPDTLELAIASMVFVFGLVALVWVLKDLD